MYCSLALPTLCQLCFACLLVNLDRKDESAANPNAQKKGDRRVESDFVTQTKGTDRHLLRDAGSQPSQSGQKEFDLFMKFHQIQKNLESRPVSFSAAAATAAG